MTARHILTILLTVATAIAATAAVRATEINNSLGTATVLPSGQRSVTDTLDGDVGRPDTILGHYNSSYTTLLGSDDNGSPLGDGTASAMLGVPLDANGGVYFRITGAPDMYFIKNHTQSGRYSVNLTVHDPLGGIVADMSRTENDDVIPYELDNIWINPGAPEPGYSDWDGFTVDVTINNILGPGTGDSLDFFTFTGFGAFQPFTVNLNAQFAGMTGWYDPLNVLHMSDPNDPLATLSGIADAAGNVTIGVTGWGDLNLVGQHSQIGQYTLTFVPEPSTGLAMGIGGMLMGWFCTTRRRGRRNGNSGSVV